MEDAVLSPNQKPSDFAISKLEIPEDDFFTTYGLAYNFVDGAQKSHAFTWRVIEAIEEHLEGKKPFAQKQLDEQGMSWAYNFNYGKARAMIESAVAGFVSKVANAIDFGTPEFRNPEPGDIKDPILKFLVDPNIRGSISSVIGSAFSEMLQTEGRLAGTLNTVEYLSYSFGYAPISWNHYDWVCKPVHLRNIAFKPGTTVEEKTQWVIFERESAINLYRTYVRVKNLTTSETDPSGTYKGSWNIEALEWVLTKLYQGTLEVDGKQKAPETWDQILPGYLANPSNIIGNTSDMDLAKIFYQEMNGDITELYIPWGYDWCKVDGKSQSSASSIPKILFKKHHTVVAEELIEFVRDSGFTISGDISKLRGIGKEAVEDSVRLNRTRNNMANKALFSGSPMFEQQSTQTQDKFRVTFSQGFTMLSPGAQLVPHQPSYNISEQIGYLNYEEQAFNKGTEHFAPSVTNRLSSRPTKDEIEVASQETNKAKSAKDTVKIADYARVFAIMLKKLCSITTLRKQDQGYKGQQKFYDQIMFCLPDLFPLGKSENKENLQKLLNTITGYSISLNLSDIQALTLAIQMSETPFARNRYRRMMLSAQGMSRREVDVCIPLYSDKYRSFVDERVAAIENDMFWSTDEVIFQLLDDHIVHFQSHMAKIQKVIDQVRQGQLDIVVGYKYCLALMAHMTQHTDALQGDPTLKGVGEDAIKAMKQVQVTLNQMAYGAQKAEQAQQQQQANQSAISPKDQTAIATQNAIAQAKIQRDDTKAQHQIDLSQQREENRHEEQVTKIENDAAAKTLQIQLTPPKDPLAS